MLVVVNQGWQSESTDGPKGALSGNPRPDLLTSLMNMALVLCRPREMPLCGSCLNVPRLPIFLKLLQHPHVFADFGKVHNPLRLPRETALEHLERPEVF